METFLLVADVLDRGARGGGAQSINFEEFDIGGLGGVWMFYIQHQFEGTYWQRHEEWDYATAAIRATTNIT